MKIKPLLANGELCPIERRFSCYRR